MSPSQDITALWEKASQLQQAGRSEEAISVYRQILTQDGQNTEALFRLGVLLQQAGAFEEAANVYQQVVALDPNRGDVWANLAIIQANLGRWDEAQTNLKKALAFDPNNAFNHNNLGHLLYRIGDCDSAVEHLLIATRLQPGFDLAWSNLGDAYRSLGQWTRAVPCYQKVLSRNPNHGEVISNLVYALRTLCRWDELDTWKARLIEISDRAVKADKPSPIDPFVACFLELDLKSFQRIVTSHAKQAQRQVANRGLTARFHHVVNRGGKIRIGYASAQFSSHAVGFVVQRLFELHDRNRFEVFGYGLRPSDHSAIRSRIKAGMDTFRDVASQTDAELAKVIYEDKIDILVDLDGFTRNHRATTFAMRPATIQVGYLGFPGTLGADYLDYIIADHRVVPPEHDGFYTEAVVRMPHSYQVNSHRHVKLRPGLRKEDYGLPADHFVFCCFNVSRKIDSVAFDLWMQILHRVPKSVLWVVPDSGDVFEALCGQATRRGVDPKRIMSAKRLPIEAYLSRCQVADLFLDTLAYCGHATGSDALWAGVPLITYPGESFASRVGASLVGAAGLPELICNSHEDYVEKAVMLATDPQHHAALREHLRQGRLTCPLFDTKRFVGDLERAFIEMVVCRDRGLRPQAIDVAAL